MKRSPCASAFTLIEMLTVMAIIAILASIVISMNGLIQTKAARAKAEGEISALKVGCENYKAENGTYPRSEETDALDPKADGNPATGSAAIRYQKASLYLYSALSGDHEPAGNPDFKPEGRSFLGEFFKPSVLSGTKNPNGQLTSVSYIQDPYGNSYGYSTKGAKAEEVFQDALRKNPSATRPTKTEGYNPTFDIWSTGGSVRGASPEEQGKWIKNW
jgi:prepilin-type N-terminal cleavage/methylation domain-containing protein